MRCVVYTVTEVRKTLLTLVDMPCVLVILTDIPTPDESVIFIFVPGIFTNIILF